MDNEAQKKYLIAEDEQLQMSLTMLSQHDLNRIHPRAISQMNDAKLGRIGESVLEHLWPYMRRGRRSPTPTIAVTVDHPGMTREAYEALAVKWGIK